MPRPTPSIAELAARVRADFKLQVFTIFGACALAGILPFVVYRFATGNPLAGGIDLAMMCLFIGAVAYAVLTQRTYAVGIFVVVVYTAGVALVSRTGGLGGALWLYPTIVCNYFLVDRRHALLASLAGLALMLLNHAVFPSGLVLASATVTALIVILFAYIFANLTQRQREQLEQVARLDPLTGAPNRRALDADPHDEGSGLLLLDLDHFKLINDRHGHHEGDRVLVAFAEVLRRSLRPTERCYRLGGEEFVVVLPHAGPQTLRDVGERLRERTQREIHTPSGPLTVSVGGCAREPGEAFEAWLQRADRLLYQAKREGRNRVVVAD